MSVDLDQLLRQEPDLVDYLPREPVLRAPRLSDVERYVRRQTQRAKQRRRQYRKHGRPLRGSGETRSQQHAPAVTPERKRALEREGVNLQPYYNENARGVPTDGKQLSTSWVDNVAFEFVLSSRGPSIRVSPALAKRVVRTEDGFAFEADGVPQLGGEFAVFTHSFDARDVIRASPDQQLRVDLSARYTQDNITVERNIRSEELGVELDLRAVHPILMSNSDNGQPVVVKGAYAVVTKDGKLLPDGPRATVVRGGARWTFRYDPTRRWWRLVRLSFAVLRHQLQGVATQDRHVYVDPRWFVEGAALPQRFVNCRIDEDYGSNPLDPEIYLEITPITSDTAFQGVPLRIGQSHRVEIALSTQLLPRSAKSSNQLVSRTLYTVLPSLEIEIPEAADLLRRTSPSAAYWVEIDREQFDRERGNFTSSENTLHNTTARVKIARTLRDDASDFEYEIVALRIGPMRQSALREALKDKRRRI